MEKVNVLEGSHKRMAFVLATEIQNLAKDFGLQRLGFLTLTFADPVMALKEAQSRFNSLNTHVIRKRYQRAIGCWERQRSGRIHFHLVVVLPGDIRTGFDFAALERGDYRSASRELRAEWAFWRKTAPAYRFGRTELLPVRSSADGIARYVGKYVSKHISQRVEADKGARVVRFIGYKPGDRRASARFSWHTVNAWFWRQHLAVFAKEQGCRDTDDLKRRYGPRWAYACQQAILVTRLAGDTVYPTRQAAERSTGLQARSVVDTSTRSGRVYVLKPFEFTGRSGAPSGLRTKSEISTDCATRTRQRPPELDPKSNPLTDINRGLYSSS